MHDLAIIDNQVSGDEIVSQGSASAAKAGSVVPDWLGVVASVGCAIHCAAMPFVIAFLPMLGLSFLADAVFHKVMVGVCLMLALAAFIPGWRLHRRWLPATVAVTGLAFISFGAFALEDSCACCNVDEGQLTAVTGEENASDPKAGLAVNSVSLSTASVCTDETCEHCAKAKQAELAAASETQATIEAPEPLMAGIAPWVTPIGGLILVSAHLINRRFACRCGCCPTETSAA